MKNFANDKTSWQSTKKNHTKARQKARRGGLKLAARSLGYTNFPPVALLIWMKKFPDTRSTCVTKTSTILRNGKFNRNAMVHHRELVKSLPDASSFRWSLLTTAARATRWGAKNSLIGWPMTFVRAAYRPGEGGVGWYLVPRAFSGTRRVIITKNKTTMTPLRMFWLGRLPCLMRAIRWRVLHFRGFCFTRELFVNEMHNFFRESNFFVAQGSW